MNTADDLVTNGAQKTKALNAQFKSVIEPDGQLPGMSYRPISLTSLVSKLFEHIISSNIKKHLESNDILHPCQHGFRKFHSCETQLISLVQDLSSNFDEGIQTDLYLWILLRPLTPWPTADYYINCSGTTSEVRFING